MRCGRRLRDELFDQSYRVPKPEETVRYLINEFEPAFDAADFSRCGRDLFVTPQRRDERSQDCWLRRPCCTDRSFGGEGWRV